MTPTVPSPISPLLSVPVEGLEAFEIEEAKIITEDGLPVESIYHEKQMRLLTHPLHATWRENNGQRKFVAMANVGVFYQPKSPPIVPDVFLSLDVDLRVKDYPKKGTKSYFMWRYGKPPDVAIEIVSETPGGELDEKKRIYAEIGVKYYVVYDPDLYLGSERLYFFELSKRSYLPLSRPWFSEVGLGLTFWDGPYEDSWETFWIRWCDHRGQLIPTGEETAEQATKLANAAKKKATAETKRANGEAKRADGEAKRAAEAEKRASSEAKRAAEVDKKNAELRELLRKAGIDPDT